MKNYSFFLPFPLNSFNQAYATIFKLTSQHTLRKFNKKLCYFKMDTQPRYAMVKEVLGRTGSRGAITQVKVEFLDQKGRTLVRNVLGPVKEGDILKFAILFGFNQILIL